MDLVSSPHTKVVVTMEHTAKVERVSDQCLHFHTCTLDLLSGMIGCSLVYTTLL